MKNKKILISCVLIFSCVLFGAYIFSNLNKDRIVFKSKYDTIEFGEKISYADTIEETIPKKMKITFPEIEMSAVGTYELAFSYEMGKETKKQMHSFKVVDSKNPLIKLKINKVDVEVAINKEYNPIANIQVVDNFIPEAMANQKKIDSKEYKKIKKDVEKANEKINDRVIKKISDIKDSPVEKNAIYYVSDLDFQKEGKYKVKVMAVDENYNIDEKEWKIKVVPAGRILNSGGIVNCDYIGKDNGSNEAYDSLIKENYSYNEHKLISRYEIITTMNFKEEYNTDKNKTFLVTAFNTQYAPYINEAGVTINIEKTENAIIAWINVDFSLYDKTKDVLDVLVNKNGEEVKIEKIIKEANKNESVCTII